MGLLESALTNPYLEMIFGLRPLLLSPSCVLRHLDRFHLSVLGPRSSFSLSLRSSVVWDLVLQIDGEADDHDHGDSRLIILIQHRDPVSGSCSATSIMFSLLLHFCVGEQQKDECA